MGKQFVIAEIMLTVPSNDISLAPIYLIVGKPESATRDRRIHNMPLENNELINKNQTRPCLLESLLRIYTRTYTLSTRAHLVCKR